MWTWMKINSGLQNHGERETVYKQAGGSESKLINDSPNHPITQSLHHLKQYLESLLISKSNSSFAPYF